MADSFVVCCRPTGAAEVDFQALDQILSSDLADLSPRALEPGVWVLRTNDRQWARTILGKLTNKMAERNAQNGCAVMVRSVGDPRDFAVHPHKADEYQEFCELEVLVRKHHLHVE